MLQLKDGGEPTFSHKRIDDLIQNQLVADKGATYAKSLYLNLSTLSPYGMDNINCFYSHY